MHRLTIRVLLASLVIGLVSPGAALAQGPSAPARPPRHFERSFGVVDAPEQFDQVLQIVDFAAGSTWTPLHTSGGYVYSTVIDGAISTRVSTATAAPTRRRTRPARPSSRNPVTTCSWATPARETPASWPPPCYQARATDDLPGRFHQRRLSCLLYFRT